MEHLKYPIGYCNESWQSKSKETLIRCIQDFPGRVEAIVNQRSHADLRKTYRPGGWTAAQVVHHCADSHMQAYARMKLAMTEDNPTIKAYYEDRWAQLPDANDTELKPSLQLLAGLHSRWVRLFNSLGETDWGKTFFHPESNRSYDMKSMAAQYAWHGEHHLAHLHLALNH